MNLKKLYFLVYVYLRAELSMIFFITLGPGLLNICCQNYSQCLTLFRADTRFKDICKQRSEDSVQTLQNAVPNLGLHFLFTEISRQNTVSENVHQKPLNLELDSCKK